MKFSPRLKWKWFFVILAGLISLLIYQYNSQLWIQAVKLYDILQDHHRLKEIISSFGAYSPLAFILLQILQVVVAPIPGGAIEFLGGVPIRGKGRPFLFYDRPCIGVLVCLRLGKVF
jgi:uncharacterized membrane protein YdjX (TVP38/TMEM64 family)